MLALSSLTGGGGSVGIVRLRTEDKEFFFFVMPIVENVFLVAMPT
jgi:hypothetical protein